MEDKNQKEKSNCQPLKNPVGLIWQPKKLVNQPGNSTLSASKKENILTGGTLQVNGDMIESSMEKAANHSLFEKPMSEHEILENPKIISSCKRVSTTHDSLALATDMPITHLEMMVQLL
ncbi:hypothetical protein ACH5RR_015668 [Cinchona calisaya]|uniref:Uncharacterized protein n=1 Tax=Cinchona calisaya TaxID=153742 RepID=A0ABD2ZTU1_9GENT